MLTVTSYDIYKNGTIDDLLDKKNLKRGASIQKKYDQLNPVHQNIINETIDAYLCKENKGTIIS